MIQNNLSDAAPLSGAAPLGGTVFPGTRVALEPATLSLFEALSAHVAGGGNPAAFVREHLRFSRACAPAGNAAISEEKA